MIGTHPERKREESLFEKLWQNIKTERLQWRGRSFRNNSFQRNPKKLLGMTDAKKLSGDWKKRRKHNKTKWKGNQNSLLEFSSYIQQRSRLLESVETSRCNNPIKNLDRRRKGRKKEWGVGNGIKDLDDRSCDKNKKKKKIKKEDQMEDKW